MTIPRSGSGRQYGYGYSKDKEKRKEAEGKGQVVPIKKASARGPDNNPITHVKTDKDGNVYV